MEEVDAMPSESVLKTCLAVKPDAYCLEAAHSSGGQLPEVREVEEVVEAVVVVVRAAQQGILVMAAAAGICCLSDGHLHLISE